MGGFDNKKHPCFSMDAAHKFARLHLPVAPRCNIKCLYCNRKFDCVNESRPGVTSSVLTPQQGLERFLETKRLMPNLAIVGVAGPGDAMANPDETFETFRLIRAADGEVDFCLSTNGVGLVEHLEKIREIGIRYITVTINTRKLSTARTLYPWAQDGDVYLKGDLAARFILNRQEEALEALKDSGIHIKVNTICIPGVNDGEIASIARYVRDKGADILNVMPFIPTPGTWFEKFPMVSREALDRIRDEMSEILPQMRHCRQCRADAVGTVLNEKPVFFDAGQTIREMPKAGHASEGASAATGEDTVRVAVASGNGYVVDLHFGHANELLIYDASPSGIRFVERRSIDKYCSGETSCETSEDRLERMMRALADCRWVLVLRIGDAPRRTLEERGIRVAMTCNRIEDAIRESCGMVPAQDAIRATP
ncbi:MAG TPA: nitrogenase cofactor biosynthesis protein NifB [Candidatus Deferrimicrobiaceae bacterium]|jgi:nitrogenase cofactor biosynthesis protein NifB